MDNERTCPSHPIIPMWFLGRPSIRYVERYRRREARR